LITDDAIHKIATSLNMTDQQAREMLLSKELQKVSANGEISQATIDKLAKQYGVSTQKATELAKAQMKQT
jgi:NADH:ubiquinone oxidoreductase subunit E